MLHNIRRFFHAKDFIEHPALFRRKFDRVIRLGRLSLAEQAVKGPHAAAEHQQFGALVAQALEFSRLEGGRIPEHPGHNPSLDRLVANGSEWRFLGHENKSYRL